MSENRRPPDPPSPRRGHDIPGFVLAVAIGVVILAGLSWLFG